MEKLICDVCGGSIVVQAGGKYGVCSYCGANYSLDRMREIVSGVKVSQTGSAEDIEQWRALVQKYMAESAYKDAEKIVKKILEAAPYDVMANAQYDELKVLRYFDIRNGVIKAYSGTAEKIIVPSGIRSIEADVFAGNQYLQEIVLPEGLKEIKAESFAGCSTLNRVSFPSTLKKIGNSAFGCTSLVRIDMPSSVKEIGEEAFFRCEQLTEANLSSVAVINDQAFYRCLSLKSVVFGSGLKQIGNCVFKGCVELETVVLPDGLEEMGYGVFEECKNLRELVIPESVKTISDGYRNFDDFITVSLTPDCPNLRYITYPKQLPISTFVGTPVFEEERRKQEQAKKEAQLEREERLRKGYCPYCNIPLSGIFTMRCRKCGKTF